MKKYGVVLNATILKQEALNQKIISNKNQALDPAQKAQLAYELIVKSSNAALGDFIRTSDGFANSQKIMEGKVEDASAAIGNVFLPMMTALTKNVASAAGWFAKFSDNTQKAIVSIGLFLLNFFIPINYS